MLKITITCPVLRICNFINAISMIVILNQERETDLQLLVLLPVRIGKVSLCCKKSVVLEVVAEGKCYHDFEKRKQLFGKNETETVGKFEIFHNSDRKTVIGSEVTFLGISL